MISFNENNILYSAVNLQVSICINLLKGTYSRLSFVVHQVLWFINISPIPINRKYINDDIVALYLNISLKFRIPGFQWKLEYSENIPLAKLNRYTVHISSTETAATTMITDPKEQTTLHAVHKDRIVTHNFSTLTLHDDLSRNKND